MALVNLAEYEAKAREILPLPVFDYYYGGAHDEITVRENCAAFQRLALHYHVLRGADRCETTVSLLGHTLRTPILVPPLAFQCMAHPEGELAAARAAAIIVSNHGGRQLDTAPATIRVLASVASAVAGRADVLVDGGIRRGTDIVKALALDARAVLVGRPVLWGLAVDGERGVSAVLGILSDELDLAMALCGCRSLAEITADLVRS